MTGSSSTGCCRNLMVSALSRGQGWWEMTRKTVKQQIKCFYRGVAVQPQALLCPKGLHQTIVRKCQQKTRDPTGSNPMSGLRKEGSEGTYLAASMKPRSLAAEAILEQSLMVSGLHDTTLFWVVNPLDLQSLLVSSRLGFFEIFCRQRLCQ